MKKKLFILFAFCFASIAFGQRSASQWYFGKGAGLDFNDGRPVVLGNGGLNTTEGSASIANATTGEILFYTEGENIFSRFNIPMDNGQDIAGSISSTQSSLIIPQPGNNRLYYVFTADEAQAYQTNGFGNGINYSIVDIGLPSSFSIVTEKNKLVLDNGSEKISGVLAANGVDYWMVTHKEDAFYAYKITAAGVSTTPVISTIGPDVDDFENIRGSLKLSPDGTKLAIAHCFFEPQFGGRAILYDFDNASGVVSNEEVLSTDLVYYGTDFSANSSKVYFSGKTKTSTTTDDIVVEQYDVNAGSVASSRFTLSTYNNDLLSDLGGMLQLALDGRIYHAQPGESLSYLTDPNNLGATSGYALQALPLGSKLSSFGLPSTVQSFVENFVLYEDVCEGDATKFTIDPLARTPQRNTITGASWNFGDPTSGTDNTSTDIEPTHQFSAAGDYTVEVTFSFAGRAPQTYLIFLAVIPKLSLPATAEVSQCDADEVDDGISTFNLNVIMGDAVGSTGFQNLEYFFYATLADAQAGTNAIANTNAFRNDTNGQIVYGTVSNSTVCNDILEITLNVEPGSNPPDRAFDICDVFMSRKDVYDSILAIGDLLLLEYGTTNTIQFYSTRELAILQSTAITQASVPPNLDGFLGVYYRISDGLRCIAIGYIEFEIIESPQEDNVFIDFCPSQTQITLELPNPYNSYSWSTGETSPTITVTEAGNYEVVVEITGGCDDQVTFVVTEIPDIQLDISIREFRQNNTVLINNTTNATDLLYSIDGGMTFQESNRFTNLKPGPRLVVVKDKLGCNGATANIVIQGAPDYFTPNGDGANDTWHLYDAGSYEDLEITIYDRYGKLLTILTNQTSGWDGRYNGIQLPSSAYWYRGVFKDGKPFAGHFSLKR